MSSTTGEVFSKKLLKNRRAQGSPKYRSVNVADLSPLPNLVEVAPAEQDELFITKLQQCCVPFDFLNTTAESPWKERKIEILKELIEYVRSHYTPPWSESVLKEIVKTISVNLFRTFPPKLHVYFDPNEDEPTLEVAWPHLNLVYDLLGHFVETTDFQLAIDKKIVDQRFISHLLDLFDSEDPRERRLVKNVLHRIYGKFMDLRPIIRKEIENVLLRFIYETQEFTGVLELLEISLSFIKGFITPLRPENKQFLFKVLLPLHKVPKMYLYHEQLTLCVIWFLDKDESLTEGVIRGILSFWPTASTQKEVIILAEIETILEVVGPAQFFKVQEIVFKHLAKCVSSPNFFVCERALYFWYNSYILSLMEDNIDIIMPIMFPALYQIAKEHWNEIIISLVYNVMKTFMEMDPELYDDLQSSYALERLEKRMKEMERDQLWKKLAELVINKQKTEVFQKVI